MRGKSCTNPAANKSDPRKIGLHPNFWYPLAIAEDVKKGRTLAVSFAGEPIVQVRTKSNKIYALEDRCAHRQVPLSCGIVVGERLQCCYHGWTYNEHGKCAVSYLPEGAPSPRGVRPYPTRVAHGLVFVFPGDPESAETVPLPQPAEFCSRNFVAICFVRRVNCHYSFMHENLMDMNHQFLHRRWTEKFKHTPFAVRKGSEHIEVDYTFDSREGGLIVRNILPWILGLPRAGAPHADGRLAAGNVDRRTQEIGRITISTQYPYQSLRLHRLYLEEPMLQLWLAYVPGDREQKISQPCGILMVRKPRFPWMVFLLRPVFEYFFNAVFEEDRFALEAEQRAHDLQGGDWNQEILPFILDLRKLLIARGIPIELDPCTHHNADIEDWRPETGVQK